MRTDIIARLRPKMTTTLGTHAWFLSSGCWKCTRMCRFATTTRMPTMIVTRMRNQL